MQIEVVAAPVDIAIAAATAATAAITGGILAVNVVTHRHERALSGTSGAIQATKTRRNWWLSDEEWGTWPKEMPAEWDVKDVRVVQTRLHNRSSIDTRAWFLSEEARFGRMRRKLDAVSNESDPLAAGGAAAPVIFVHRQGGWTHAKSSRFHFVWEMPDGELVRYDGPLVIKSPPLRRPTQEQCRVERWRGGGDLTAPGVSQTHGA